MTLGAGTRLGNYEVISSLGAGGMGEVYRARDTTLGREVAIKVLPQGFSDEPERGIRFEREAKVLASLNHNNIATLYGFESDAGTQFLVMEVIEGQTLAERIERGAIPVHVALPLFHQIAQGLEAAHEKGVVHRDLKPANIKVTDDGQVKILDFGLAKAIEERVSEADFSHSPTLTVDATQAGVLRGTAAYMSPEQARGRAIDKRSDIWAFGVCLFEALSGKHPFRGEDVPGTLAKVLETEPNLSMLPSDLSPGLRRAIGRCLRKDLTRRTHDIADVRIALEDSTGEGSEELGALTVVTQPVLARVTPWVVSMGFAALAAVLSWQATQRVDPLTENLEHYEFEIPRTLPWGTSLSLSPDGRNLTYAGVSENGDQVVFRRSLGRLGVQEIEGTLAGEYQFFSHDSKWLVFHAEGELRKVPIEGGRPVVICRTPEALGGAWGPKDDIVFSGSDGLYRISANGGEPIRISNPSRNESVSHVWPRFLPDGDSVLFTIWTGSSADAQIAVLPITGGVATPLIQGSNATYSPTGHIVFQRDGALMAAPFDPDTSEVSGDPVEVVPELLTSVFGGGYYMFAESGHLVYLDSPSSSVDATLVSVDRAGKATPKYGESDAGWLQPQFSVSGARLAYVRGSKAFGGIHSYDFESGRSVPVVLPRGGTLATWPVWGPNDKWIAFVSNRTGGFNTFRALADGGGSLEQLTFEPDLRTIPSSWSTDNVLAIEQGPNNQRDILMLPMGDGGDMQLHPFQVGEANERGAKFSPDGRWISFTSDRSGRDEVWVAAYPGGGAPKPVSIDGGKEPVWSRDGRELFYRNGDEMWAVPIELDPTFRAGQPKLLFRGEYSYGYLDWSFNYDVHPDGRSFLMVRPGPVPKVQVLVNWFEELERLVPTD